MRLFAATLAALALTLALALGIGAVLTRQQVDKTQAAALAARADDLATQRKAHVNYTTQNALTKSVRTIVQARGYFVGLVPNVNKSSNGETDYGGKRELYSYRTLPDRGLLMLRPASSRAAAWRPFLWDLVLAAAIGVAFAAFVSFFLARSIVGPIRRVVTRFALMRQTSDTSRFRSRGRASSRRSPRRSIRWQTGSRARVRPSATSCSPSRTS